MGYDCGYNGGNDRNGGGHGNGSRVHRVSIRGHGYGHGVNGYVYGG